ncbi:MAG: hypothetical protein WEB09_09295 [Nitriliruptor sp.]
MTGLVAAEVRKLTSVRSTWILTVIGWLLASASALALVTGAYEPFQGTSQQVADTIASAGGKKVGQGLVGSVLTVLLGVAFGALVRAQVVAIVVALVWIFVIENLFAALLPEVGRWLPFQALNGLFVPQAAAGQMPDGMVVPLTGLAALLVFTAWVVVFTAAAAVLLRKRDV